MLEKHRVDKRTSVAEANLAVTALAHTTTRLTLWTTLVRLWASCFSFFGTFLFFFALSHPKAHLPAYGQHLAEDMKPMLGGGDRPRGPPAATGPSESPMPQMGCSHTGADCDNRPGGPPATTGPPENARPLAGGPSGHHGDAGADCDNRNGGSGSAQSINALEPRRTTDTLDVRLDDNTATRQRRPSRCGRSHNLSRRSGTTARPYDHSTTRRLHGAIYRGASFGICLRWGMATSFAPSAFHNAPFGLLLPPSTSRGAALRTRSLVAEEGSGAAERGLVEGCGARGLPLRPACVYHGFAGNAAGGFYTEVLGGDFIARPMQGTALIKSDAFQWQIFANKIFEAWRFAEEHNISRAEALRRFAVPCFSSPVYNEGGRVLCVNDMQSNSMPATADDCSDKWNFASLPSTAVGPALLPVTAGGPAAVFSGTVYNILGSTTDASNECVTDGSGPDSAKGEPPTVCALGEIEGGPKFWSTHDPAQQPLSYETGGGGVIAGYDQGCLGIKIGEVRK